RDTEAKDAALIRPQHDRLDRLREDASDDGDEGRAAKLDSGEGSGRYHRRSIPTSQRQSEIWFARREPTANMTAAGLPGTRSIIVARFIPEHGRNVEQMWSLPFHREATSTQVESLI
ncbi:MAG: hypothetical protein H0U10_15055, partial [Chloroflexia bacterium]|nr:hypothetical protein [Chloroflexia bacterium]